METKDEFFAELNALGEREVRIRRATRYYGDVNERGAWADEWLLAKELDRQSRNERRTRRAEIMALIASVIAIASAISTIMLHWWSTLLSLFRR